MIETAFVFGVIIAAGILVVMVNMPLRLRNWCLRHHVFVDICVTVLVLWIHWGTMTGLMAATFAGLICTLCMLAGRWWWRVA